MLPGMRRLVSILVSGTLLLLGSPTAANAAVQPGWRLRWAPDAARDGLAAFEHAEDDRANSDPARAPHISVDGDAYRFVMHMEDRDTSTDRQRHEVRGMRNGDQTVNMLYGDAWRFTYSMFIPDTLKATTTFSHIMQMKEPGTGSSPIIVQSLRRTAGRPTLELRVFDSDTLVGAVDLDGKLIKGFKAKGVYQSGKSPKIPGSSFVNGVTGDVYFEKQQDGRWRSSQLLPDEEVLLTAEADGWEPRSEKVKLAEGEIKELKVTLQKASAKNEGKD